MPAMVLRYQLDPGELAAASYDHGPTVRRAATRQKVLGGASLVLGAALASATVWAGALAGVGGLMLALGTRFSIVRRTRWVFERTPFATDPVTAMADEQGVRFTTASSDLWYAWSSYASVSTASDGIALVSRGGTNVRWIPSRAFADADQLTSFAAQARRGIGLDGPTI